MRNNGGTLFPVAACAAPGVTSGGLEKKGRDSRPSHWIVLTAQVPSTPARTRPSGRASAACPRPTGLGPSNGSVPRPRLDWSPARTCAYPAVFLGTGVSSDFLTGGFYAKCDGCGGE